MFKITLIEEIARKVAEIDLPFEFASPGDARAFVRTNPVGAGWVVRRIER
jgi:hypothetical protein